MPHENPITVCIQRLSNGHNLSLPYYASEGAAAMDICSAIDTPLAPMERKLIPTGFAIALPAGFEAQVRPRSGLALKHGITVLNTPGTIDADYRGEVCVLLINLSNTPFSIARGDRIAQLLVAPVTQAKLKETTTLPPSQRGDKGFGSTGLKQK